MTHVNERVIVGQSLEAGTPAHERLQERGVLGQGRIREARPLLPQTLPEGHGAADDPLGEHPTVQLRGRGPELSSRQRQEEPSIQTADVRSAL